MGEFMTFLLTIVFGVEVNAKASGQQHIWASSIDINYLNSDDSKRAFAKNIGDLIKSGALEVRQEYGLNDNVIVSVVSHNLCRIG